MFRENSLWTKTRKVYGTTHNNIIVEQQVNKPTTEEIGTAIEMLANGKAPVEDNITPELPKKQKNGD